MRHDLGRHIGTIDEKDDDDGDDRHNPLGVAHVLCSMESFRVGEDFTPAIIEPYKVDAYLFDTLSQEAYGGTGKNFDWSLLKDIKSANVPIILSGGLNSQNVIEPVNHLKPYAVDVNSGVELAPGQKDHGKVKEFIDIVNYITGPKVKEF